MPRETAPIVAGRTPHTLSTATPPEEGEGAVVSGVETGSAGPAGIARTFARQAGVAGGLRLLLRGRRPGVTLALLGPDGSGKSWLATDLEQTAPLPTRTVYMGLWKGTGVGPRGQHLPGWSLGRRLLFAWRQYLVGQWHRRQGRLVIFDRYTYDALLPATNRLSRKDRLYLWLLGHACPAPDLTIVLDMPGRTMYERKGESCPEDLEEQRQGYLLLRQHIPRLAVVDGSRQQEKVRADVSDRVWKIYVGRDRA